MHVLQTLLDHGLMFSLRLFGLADLTKLLGGQDPLLKAAHLAQDKFGQLLLDTQITKGINRLCGPVFETKNSEKSAWLRSSIDEVMTTYEEIIRDQSETTNMGSFHEEIAEHSLLANILMITNAETLQNLRDAVRNKDNSRE